MPVTEVAMEEEIAEEEEAVVVDVNVRFVS
jgi:hypothetical protein